MRNSPFIASALVCALAVAGGGAAMAGQATRVARPAHVAAPKPDCPRANYPGDPICAWEDDGKNLPTPSARAVRREIPDDVMINDQMSLSGADPVAMGRPPAVAGNPYPVRKKEPLGGGAAVNYKF
ncbi:MAG TPA: hypothetical protein P5256_15610 [Beijerinckiaceae bacterium]|nr:hypothetical protein [Beijerinckiaceae bacterium]